MFTIEELFEHVVWRFGFWTLCVMRFLFMNINYIVLLN